MKTYMTKETAADGQETTEYSDDFAGVFIDDDGILNIGVVADKAQIQSLQTTSELCEQAIYREDTYTYNYLQEIMSVIEPKMEEYGIFTIGISERDNNVFVDLGNEDSSHKIVAFLEEKGLYSRDALSFRVNPDGTNTQNANMAHAADMISDGNDVVPLCALN